MSVTHQTQEAPKPSKFDRFVRDCISVGLVVGPFILITAGFVYTAIDPSCEDGGPCSRDQQDSDMLQNELDSKLGGITDFNLNGQTHRFSFTHENSQDDSDETCIGNYRPSDSHGAASIVGKLVCDGHTRLVTISHH